MQLPYTDTLFGKKSIMKIKNLRLTNFRCFSSLDIQFEPQLTVLVAPNGGGKSTLLDAVAIGLGPFLSRLPNCSGINPKHTDFRVLPDGRKPSLMRIELETYDGISWDRNMRGNKSEDTKKLVKGKGFTELNKYVDTLVQRLYDGQHPMFPVIIYYGTGRGVFDTPQRRGDFKKDFTEIDSYRHALDAKTNFRQFFNYFYFLEDLERREKEKRRDWDYQQPELMVIREAISRMMPEFSNPKSALRPLRFLVDWKRNSTIPLSIQQLSDGYRTTLAMVMDITARMAGANPAAEKILDTEGIVLIDEIDLHLHPKWQQTILPDLMKTFPKLQFIVSTHSPQVLSTVPSDCIRLINDERDPETGLQKFVVEKPLTQSRGRASADVMAELMDVDPVPEVEEARWLSNYKALIQQNLHETEEGKSLHHRLERHFCLQHKEMLECDRLIRLAKMKAKFSTSNNVEE